MSTDIKNPPSEPIHTPPRLDIGRINPKAAGAQMAMEEYVRGCDLQPSLIHLVKLRASYLNGCAYCVDMHSKDALLAGEGEQRLLAVPVWKETPFFTDRERAAFAWTDAVTEVGRTGVPDEVFEHACRYFTETELVDLTIAVVTINGWNRLAVSFRMPVGSYTPRGGE